MNEQLKELFFNEQDQGRLIFEDNPEYNDLLHQSLSLFPDGDLPKAVFLLLETSNCISFAHGLKLGLKLKQWAIPSLPPPLGEVARRSRDGEGPKGNRSV